MLLPPLRVNIKKSPVRVDLQEALSRTSAQEKGTEVLWQRAVACPCATDATVHDDQVMVGLPPLDCEVCGGVGKIYGAPQPTVMMLADASNPMLVFTVWGELSRGAVEVTAMPENLLSEWDRITLVQGTVTLTEWMVRKGVVERPRYEVVKRTFPIGSGEGLLTPQEVIVGVTDCYVASPSGVVYSTPRVEGVDFIITDDGYIDWTLGDSLGTAPAIGARYSVRYFARPVYVVRDHPYIRRDFYELIKGEMQYKSHPTKAIALQEWLGLTDPPVTGRGPAVKEQP